MILKTIGKNLGIGSGHAGDYNYRAWCCRRRSFSWKSLVILVAFLLGEVRGVCGDSLVCFELRSTNRLVQSAVLQIPANTTARFGFESNNRFGELAFSQGCLLQIEGRTFVKYQADFDSQAYSWPEGYLATNQYFMSIWNARSFPQASQWRGLINYGYAKTIRGPASVSFFCRRAELRGTVYVTTDGFPVSSFYTQKILSPKDAPFRLVIPSNSLGGVDLDTYGEQSPVAASVSGSRGQFIFTNQITYSNGLKFPVALYENKERSTFFGESSATNEPSSVVTWAKISKPSNSRTVGISYLGPATITYAYTNATDASSFARLRYYISPANIAYNNLLAKAEPLKIKGEEEFRPQRLVLERSSDGKKWTKALGGVLTNSVDEATYRLRLEQI